MLKVTSLCFFFFFFRFFFFFFSVFSRKSVKKSKGIKVTLTETEEKQQTLPVTSDYVIIVLSAAAPVSSRANQKKKIHLELF